ncbi:MAG: DUF1566 domain-containing protein [Thiobacillaceae bacterium]
MKFRHALIASTTLGTMLLSATAAHAALQAVTLDGIAGAGVYDTDRNITWLANANLAATDTFGVAGISANGSMASWATAESWIAAMNAADYLGYNTWELPTTPVVDTCGSSGGYNCTNSMMGHLFYTELGGTAGSSITTTHTNAAGYNLFNNIQAADYWSGTVFASDPSEEAWLFVMEDGLQGIASQSSDNVYAWAVIPGAVPEADTWAMLLVGLGLVGLVVRRRG